jgi:ubiquinone/menaquinone biosynthesis C-methylase UbiE
VTVAPEQYERWRRSALGEVTDRIEHALVLTLVGSLAGKRVLDVCCGDGVLAIAAAARGAQVTGVDISQGMLDVAKERAASQGVVLRLQQADARALPFPDASFDVALAMTSLCMVTDAEAAVKEMARVVVPGGRVVIGELGRLSLWAIWRSLRRMLGNATWRGARFWTARELKALLRSAGLDPGTVRGAIYYPPVGPIARLCGPIDGLPRAITTLGAAFLAAVGSKPPVVASGEKTIVGMTRLILTDPSYGTLRSYNGLHLGGSLAKHEGQDVPMEDRAWAK